MPSITAAELFSSDGTVPSDVLLVDVRSAEEQNVSRIPGALADVCFLDQLSQSQSLDQRLRIVIYCTAGVRSLWFCLAHRARCGPLVNLVDGIVGFCNLECHPSLETLDGRLTRSVHTFSPFWNAIEPDASYNIVTR